jgi:hypothetical protein
LELLTGFPDSGAHRGNAPAERPKFLYRVLPFENIFVGVYALFR